MQRRRCPRAKVAAGRAVQNLRFCSSAPDRRHVSSSRAKSARIKVYPLARKRIIRHAESCANCTSSKKRSIAAIALAGLPVLVAPSGILRGTVELLWHQLEVPRRLVAQARRDRSNGAPCAVAWNWSGAPPSPSADGGPTYVSESAGGVPAVVGAEGCPDRQSTSGVLTVRVGRVVGTSLVGSGCWLRCACRRGGSRYGGKPVSRLLARAEVPAAGQTQTSSSSAAVPTGEPAPSARDSDAEHEVEDGATIGVRFILRAGSGSGSGSDSSGRGQQQPISQSTADFHPLHNRRRRPDAGKKRQHPFRAVRVESCLPPAPTLPARPTPTRALLTALLASARICRVDCESRSRGMPILAECSNRGGVSRSVQQSTP